MTNLLDFNKFYSAFITAALWSSTDDNDEPLDANYDADDISEETAVNLEAIARVFWYRNSCYLEAIACENGIHSTPGYTLDESAGHDLWLTMNGHGAGFMDRDFYRYESDVTGRPIEYRDMFTKAAKAMGGVDLYKGDDGKVWA